MNKFHRHHIRSFAVGFVVLLTAASCSSAGSSTEDTSTEDTSTEGTSAEETTNETDQTVADVTTSGSTQTGVEQAQWGDNVEISIGDGSFQFVSDGLPNHELPDQFLVPNEGNMPPFDGDDIAAEFYIADTEDLIVASPLDLEISLNPVYSEEVTETSLSTIGVLISGAPLFNDYEDQSREFVALDDNLSLEGAFFIDSCNGHPLASGSSYHYHGVPYCITDEIDVEGEHSTIIGVLLDGFPIYGPQDADGVTITNDELDECSGHDGPTPEFPEGIYHYHLTEDANPYSIDCFHGEIDYGNDGGQGGPPGDGGGTPNDGGPPGDGGGAPNDGGPPGDGGGPPNDGGPPGGGQAPSEE